MQVINACFLSMYMKRVLFFPTNFFNIFLSLYCRARERRGNKSLHFDGSSLSISSIYEVSIAGAQQQWWQQLPAGSHLLLRCALPSREENEEGDRREKERGRVRGGG